MRINTQSWREWAFIVTLIGCAQFVVLTIIAMFVYPGGTKADPATAGYSFWSNFFSDLGRTTTFSGEPGTASFPLFTAALALAGLALILFFIVMPHLFTNTRTVKRLSIMGSVVGIVTGLSYIGIASTPWDLYTTAHKLFVYVGFSSFLLVVALYSAAIFLNKGYPNVYAFVFVSFAVILAAYLWLLFAGPDVETDEGVRINATGQKIVVYAEIVCMFIQAYGAVKMQRKYSAALPRS